MALVVRAFPVLTGQEKAVQRFLAELTGERQYEARHFFTRFGVCRESWYVQPILDHTWIIVVTELTGDPQNTAQVYAASQNEFDRWFKDQIYQLCGIQLDETPLGPPAKPLFSWDESSDTLWHDPTIG